MCDCLAWNPLWATIAREARVRRPAVVLAVLYLRSAPDQPMARSALVIGSIVGMRPETLNRLLGALRAHDVINDENEPIGAWAVTRDVTPSHRPMTGAERTAKWRAKCRAAAQKSADPVDRDGPSRSITPSRKPHLSLLAPPDDLSTGEGRMKREDARARQLALIMPLQGFAEKPAPSEADKATNSGREAHAGNRRRGDGRDAPRAERLAADWQPDAEDIGFAQELGLDPGWTGDKFRDHWHAASGAGAAKRDWKATWRNWCRREVEQFGGAPAGRRAGGDRPGNSITARAISRLVL